MNNDPIRPIEEALIEARHRIAKMRDGNFATIVAAQEAIVRVGEFTVDAFRIIQSTKPLIDP